MEAVAPVASVAEGRPVRPQSRVDQLAHLQPTVRERIPVHARNVDVGGWISKYVGVSVTEGAVVPRVAGMEERRRIMAGVAQYVKGVWA